MHIKCKHLRLGPGYTQCDPEALQQSDANIDELSCELFSDFQSAICDVACLDDYVPCPGKLVTCENGFFSAFRCIPAEEVPATGIPQEWIDFPVIT